MTGNSAGEDVPLAAPHASWLRTYHLAWLGPDLLAGLTVAVLLVPQAMAYAMLAGLPPISGLYAALGALVVYALLGSSRQLSVGPVALDSILVASGVGLIAQAGSANYIAIAMLLALMVGAIQVGMGMLRLGFLVNFLANPVISGFTSAAAIIIAVSQLKHLIGVEVATSQNPFLTLYQLGGSLGQANLPTVVLGLACLATLWILKKLHRQVPAALIVLALATSAVWLLGLEAMGVAVIGQVPAGLPRLQLPDVDLRTVLQVVPLAITIALVGFMESVAVAKKVAADQRYRIDGNRELGSLGASNIAAGLSGGYPVAGGFSRTAVNVSAGAKSQLSSLFTALALAAVLLTLTGAFKQTPKVCLAVIIIAAVGSLVDLEAPRRLWQVNKKELLLLGMAFFATLAFGVQNGVLLSVLASIALIFSRITRPPVAVFGKVPATGAIRNMARAPQAEEVPGILVFRVGASLYFANTSYVQDRLYEALGQREDLVHSVLFDASTINEIDSSAISGLQDLARDLRENGMDLYFTNTRGRVIDVMKRGGFYQQLGADHFFFSKRTALDHIQANRQNVGYDAEDVKPEQ